MERGPRCRIMTFERIGEGREMNYTLTVLGLVNVVGAVLSYIVHYS